MEQPGPITDIAKPGIKAHRELAISLREEVARILGRSSIGFPGAQPVSFARKHLEELRREDYYVCEKSDGIRYLLYLTVDEEEQEVQYLIDRKNDYWFLPRNSMHFPMPNDIQAFHRGTLIDGELVMDTVPGTDRKEPRFLVFDLLALDDKAELLHKPLDKRLGYFSAYVYDPYKKLLQQFPQEIPFMAFKVEMKRMELSYGIETMFREVIPALKHDSDGLIFTCRTTPYHFGTDPHILKWKAPHENTLDFRLRLQFPTVQATDQELDEDYPEQFTDYDSVPQAELHIFLGNDGPGGSKYELFPDPLYISEEEWETLKVLGDPLQDRVVECCLDSEGRWRLFRFRDDKNEANHTSTVQSVMASIKDGVSDSELLSAATAIKESWKIRAQKRRAEQQQGQGQPKH